MPEKCAMGKHRSRPRPITAPFIQRYATMPYNSASRDDNTSEEPLPETVALTTTGLTIARATRLTEVHQETTDDR